MNSTLQETTPADIRSLSSGTMSKLLLDSGLVYSTVCGDYWTIDKWQAAFARFVAASAERYETWQDAWRAYVKHTYHITNNCWSSSYQGSTDYKVNGVRFAVREHGCEDYGYAGDYWETGIKPLVGTLLHAESTKVVPEIIATAFPYYVRVYATYDWEDRGERYSNGQPCKSIVNWKWHWPDGQPEQMEVMFGTRKLVVNRSPQRTLDSVGAELDWEVEWPRIKAARREYGLA